MGGEPERDVVGVPQMLPMPVLLYGVVVTVLPLLPLLPLPGLKALKPGGRPGPGGGVPVMSLRQSSSGEGVRLLPVRVIVRRGR